ncbi:hypothetical protein [Streptomyces sp. NRRL S-337]|uniref:hypothetical protein n=1 Tax=Streptomyces sp. NRRL S-337 TaxID=1463900 RepID=UPI00131A8959|nr:hypothetical protein [Streptomyces sp. NRRL S-337]
MTGMEKRAVASAGRTSHRRRRVAGLLLLLIGLVGLDGPSPAATVARPKVAPVALGQESAAPYGDPMYRYLYEGRIFDGYDSEDRAGVNYAVAWLRVTDYTARQLRIFDKELFSRFDRRRGKWDEVIYRKLRTAAEIKREDPGLFHQLNELGLRPDDVTLQVVARSARYRGEAVGHSEELILRRLGEIEYTFKRLKAHASLAEIEKELQTKNGVDITPERLIGGASERAPCDYAGGPRCARYSKDMRFLVPYGTKEEQRQATGRVKGLIQQQNEWRDRNGDGLFDPPPTGAASRTSGAKRSSGPRSPRQMVAGAAIGAPGGIDFTTVELRYLSASPGNRLGFTYGFTAQRGAGKKPPNGLQSLRETSDSFYVWLALDPSKLWVNLNPNEPDRIIDKQLARTDAGRVLLEADLRLKQIDANLLYRDTAVGNEYWKRRGNNVRCFDQRLWITPGEAKVYTKGDELYILDAPLKVEAEPDNIGNTGNRSHRGCPRLSADAEIRVSAAYNALVLPRIVREVNEGAEFAALRRVYLSRIAAEWIRQRTAVQETGFEYAIDSGDVSRWTSKRKWSPHTVFERYAKYYDTMAACRTCTKEQLYRIASGGVNFGRVVKRNVSKAEFDAKWRHVVAGRAYLKGASLSQPKPGAEAAPIKPKPPDSSSPWALLSDIAGSNRHLGIELIVIGVLALLIGWRIVDRRRPTRADPSRRDGSGTA